MKARKILMIGIDGGTWDIFDALIDSGVMPTLDTLRQNGGYGVLHSTMPPVTAPAWTTLMTGVQPGKHQVVDFEEYNCETNSVHPTTSQTIAVETMWKRFSKKGFRVASLNMPQTYPPMPVNGVLVSGQGCPGVRHNITWPSELKQKILSRIPDYGVLSNWEGKIENPRVFDKAISCSRRSFENSLSLFQVINEQYSWDVLMLQIQQNDLFQHKCWPYLDPNNWNRYPGRTRKIHELFHTLDSVIATMAFQIDPNRDALFIVSDHGHGKTKALVRPNKLLQKWGFLQKQSRASGLKRKLKRNVRMNEKKGDGPSSDNIMQKLKVDPNRTKAFVAHSNQQAFLYINEKGRQPNGIVDPQEKAPLLKKLKRRFMEYRDPDNGQRIFEDVKYPAELYETPQAKPDIFGDLILIAAEGYWFKRATKGPVVQKDNIHQFKGCHRPNGMYVAYGNNIQSGVVEDANLVDILPTLYAMMGVSIPSFVDGRVMQNVFGEVPPIEIEEQNHLGQIPPNDAFTLDKSEQEIISQHLKDIGYL